MPEILPRGCCEHLMEFKKDDKFHSLAAVRHYMETVNSFSHPHRGPAEAHKPKNMTVPSCSSCASMETPLFACLHCVYFSCSEHKQKHITDTHNTHILWMELSSMTVFCSKCNKYVYHPDWLTGNGRALKRKKQMQPLSVSSSSLELEHSPSSLDFIQPGLSQIPVFSVSSVISQPSSSPLSLSTARNDLGTPRLTASSSSLLSLSTSGDGKSFNTFVCDLLEEKRKSLTLLNSNGAASPYSTVKHPVVRGFYNMGNTCYLNCVLQCLIHNPMLRCWALSDLHYDCPSLKPPSSSSTSPSHSSSVAPIKNPPLPPPLLLPKQSTTITTSSSQQSQSSSQSQQQKQPLCMVCELISLIRSLFPTKITEDSDTGPLVPNKFFTAFWEAAKDHVTEACDDPRDAFEFFLQVLDIIHDTVTKDSSQKKTQNCQCPVHAIFSGIQRSDITCDVCKTTKNKEEPFLSVSLDIAADDDDDESKSETEGKGKMRTKLNTLAECLSRYIKTESLKGTEEFFCDVCKEKHEAKKRMCFSELANVMCFHIKRLVPKNGDRFTKLNYHLEFPCVLDMKPYTYSSVEKKEKKLSEESRTKSPVSGFSETNPMSNGEKDDLTWESLKELDEDDTDGIYELFAVITQVGDEKGGHYLAYVRSGRAWYLCNDDTVTKVHFSAVLRTQAYLLFYVRRSLVYSDEPTPIPIREPPPPTTSTTTVPIPITMPPSASMKPVKREQDSLPVSGLKVSIP